jgi:hypothetical protein
MNLSQKKIRPRTKRSEINEDVSVENYTQHEDFSQRFKNLVMDATSHMPMQDRLARVRNIDLLIINGAVDEATMFHRLANVAHTNVGKAYSYEFELGRLAVEEGGSTPQEDTLTTISFVERLFDHIRSKK